MKITKIENFFVVQSLGLNAVTAGATSHTVWQKKKKKMEIHFPLWDTPQCQGLDFSYLVLAIPRATSGSKMAAGTLVITSTI